MIFNSYGFIFIFLPIVLISYFVVKKNIGFKASKLVIVASSFIFYGYWNYLYLPIIITSILFNYYCALRIQENRNVRTLVLSILFNLFSIGYFKYYGFFIDTINTAFKTNILFETVFLPLAISFFTFQQISFLVDVYRKEIREIDFLDYSLFVTFFPQLIAGPIVHHNEIIPQFNRKNNLIINWEFFGLGIVVFGIGLFKKVIIADDLAINVTLIFNSIEQNKFVAFFAAWSGAIGYAFQLYFDFSGYSDMAFGLALFFGIKLPINFFSPYRSVNVITFWRTWHMSLSRFLRDYIYFPLGGNKAGHFRKMINLMLTMLLGGLWHGAGWNFIIWGGIHGLYLMLNNLWKYLKPNIGLTNGGGAIRFRISQLFTFICIVVAWVFFRSESFDGAIRMLHIMFGFEGINISHNISYLLVYLPSVFVANNMIGMFEPVGDGPTYAFKLILLYLWVVFLPNTYELIRQHKFDELHVKNIKLEIFFRPTFWWSLLMAIIYYISISSIGSYSEFLYFRF